MNWTHPIFWLLYLTVAGLLYHAGLWLIGRSWKRSEWL